jgi:SNF family Na+-dependent transporter
MERWTSQVGVILAAAGSAVGLGNYLRFPGKAAAYGGGTFMIPYFVSLLIIGIPIAWVEWTFGRYGGTKGYNSAPGIFSTIWNRRGSRYIGVIALLIPAVIYMYYVYIEAWCLAYTGFYLTGILPLDAAKGAARYSDFFNEFVGAKQDGIVLGTTLGGTAIFFLLAVSAYNFYLVYRGISKGIERFVRWAMPTLIVLSVIIMVRVLTLGTPDPAHPELNVWNGLGFMWNPKPMTPGAGTFSALLNPQMWLEAAGQIFFTLSVGFGILMVYASYLRRNDDVALSALTTVSTNELCEVVFGGLITLPAAFIFLGAAPLANVLGSTLGLGFHTFPQIFERMPAGALFGAMWFFMLFIAAITSSVSMLQPVLVFLENECGLSRKKGVAVLGGLTIFGNLLVVYFSKDLVALDTMDFWVGSVLIYILATIMVILFGWVFPLEKGLKEAARGADFRIPRFFAFVIKYVCPAYLLVIFGAWMYGVVPGYVRTLAHTPQAMITLAFIILTALIFVVLIRRGSKRFFREPAQ